ncbi:MAG: AAA family ATPase [Candidatus Pacebacteria bacterium]|nr:AAA family ATPase [Candidatus Paceibacterota bacterium]
MTQDEALHVLKTGANVFLTGEPGSGKTYTINRYIKYLREHGVEPAITASTGIAATHVGGMTIHSWSGIGVREYLSEYDVEAISENKNVRRRIKDTHVLIIDEVSMLSGSVLGMVDQVLRAVKEVSIPFGGMQIILVGDFFQLPPIVKRFGLSSGEYDESAESPFAFSSPAWRELNPVVCYLEEQYRQGDATFAKLLGKIRARDALEGVHHILEARTVKEHEAPKDAPRLFSHNSDVDRINDERLHQIPGRMHTFAMVARGGEGLIASLKRGCLSPEHLLLKEGARVMFTKNDPAGKFVNGTLGEVVSISMAGAPTVRTHEGRHIDVEQAEWTMEEGGRILARIAQLPLRLAWAITVHKSQGMTLDAAVVDLTKAFEFGQGYVALSRVRTLAGLHLLGYNRRALEVHPEVHERDQDFKESSADARERFGAMNSTEHETYVRRFLSAAGGSIEGGVAPRAKKKSTVEKGATQMATLGMLKGRKSIKDIAKTRGLKESTIIDHVEHLYMRDIISIADVARSVPTTLTRAMPKIEAAFKRHGIDKLTPVFNELKGVYSFDELKLARILYKAQ